MREIKFRGKDKYNPTGWVYGSGISTIVDIFGNPTKKKVIVRCCDLATDKYGEDLFGYDEVIPKTIGQYTGFKDNNGVEIYEGDLVVLTDDPNKIKGEIYWNEVYGRYDVWWKINSDTIHNNIRRLDWLNYHTNRGLMVVGSIHDEVNSND